MIVCHERKIIYVKAKKVGGTSFEIALSKFCGPSCIIAPISPSDEDFRKNLGYRSAQNYFRAGSGDRISVEFFNHMTSAQIRNNLPDFVWKNYKKITTVRNPYEVLVSMYFWRQERRSFKEFVMSSDAGINENELIAPIFGNYKLDVYLKYEDMRADLLRNNLDYLVDGMSQIRAKGGIRPKHASVGSMFKEFPELIDFVEERCINTLTSFCYSKPNIF